MSGLAWCADEASGLIPAAQRHELGRRAGTKAEPHSGRARLSHLLSAPFAALALLLAGMLPAAPAWAQAVLVSNTGQATPIECKEQYNELLGFSTGKKIGERNIYLKWFQASGNYIDCISRLSLVEGKTEENRVPKCHKEFSALYDSYWEGIVDLGPEAYYETSLKAQSYMVCTVSR